MLVVERAQYRQLCHEQARMAAVLHEAAAKDEHELAEKVVSQWPAVFAAWLGGDIDRPVVRVFDRYLTGLAQGQVAGICQVAVPRAGGLTTGQLAVLLRRMVIAVDPDAAARWYRKAVAERNLIAYPAADGTITLSANGLCDPARDERVGIEIRVGLATLLGLLGALCPHAHRVKHRGGWRVEQPEPGTFVWRSPLGGEYRTTAEQLLPLMPDLALAARGDVRAGPTARDPRLDAVTTPPDGPILRRPRATQTSGSAGSALTVGDPGRR
jgi:hypothetical protein